MDEILWSDHSNEGALSVLQQDTILSPCIDRTKFVCFFFLKHFVPLGAQVMINLQIEDQSQKDLVIV